MTTIDQLARMALETLELPTEASDIIVEIRRTERARSRSEKRSLRRAASEKQTSRERLAMPPISTSREADHG